MRRVVIDMQNVLFADAIRQSLVQFDSDFEPHRVNSPAETAELCGFLHPYALIMEVSGKPPWSLDERLKIRAGVLACAPECKIVIVVDENAEQRLAVRVRQAKKDGLITNSIYGSVSATYLSAVIDAL